jgi:hypothetical protein
LSRETFESGIRKAITWYLQNEAWVKEVTAETMPAGWDVVVRRQEVRQKPQWTFSWHA